MCESNFTTIHPIVERTFHSKTKNVNLALEKMQEITKIIRIHPPDTTNLCTQFHDKPSNSYFTKIPKHQPAVGATRTVRG